MKRYEDKNPEELPLIKKKGFQSSNNLNNFRLSDIVGRRANSNSVIRTSVRIKKVIK